MMRFFTRPLHLATVAACAALSACGKDTPVEPRKATKVEVLAGAGQVGGVGAALPVKILVRTSDAQGALGGVAVSATTESPGGGSAAPTAFTTGANGQAEITWTLGSHIGAQTLTLTVSGIAPVIVSATGQIGPAAVILTVSETFQFTVVSRAVSLIPSVRVTDAFGNPVQGAPVTFDAPVAGSVLTGTQAVTDASGVATLGSWIIGPDALSYTVRALIPSGPAAGQTATFSALGVPATVVAIAGSGQTSNAGTAVPVVPAVLASRGDGSPLPGVTVAFVVTGGGGAIQGASAVTGSDGIARPTAWVLGTVPGNNQASAQVGGVPPVNFTATGVPGVASSVIASSPTIQSGFFGNFLGSFPRVTLSDAQGHPVAGTAVTFELLQADGQLVGANQVSDAFGHATLDGWRLGSGPSEGVRAVVAGFPPVSFTANASTPPASTFKLEVRYRSVADGCLNCQTPTPAQRNAFDLAAARWKQILLAGAAPYPVNEAASSCFPAINETVDGLLIFASLVPIDGVNNILGRSGPCIVRDDHGFQPAVGLMEFDTADLVALEGRSQLNDVILHEMGHVLGFGTMWDFDPRPFELIPIGPDNPPNTLLSGRGTSDPVFTGLSTRAAFLGAVALGRTFTGVPVPVENSGGVGTRDSHWRETTATTELMTGFISNSGTANPLSAFTITQFRDLGYVVNDAVADPFTFLASLQAAPGLPSLAGGFQLNEAPLLDPIIVIDRQGRRVARVPRR
jgi:hypothetical protein